MSAIDKAIEALARNAGNPETVPDESKVAPVPVRLPENDRPVEIKDSPRRNLELSAVVTPISRAQKTTHRTEGRVSRSETVESLKLPVEKMKTLGLITPDMPRSQIAEEYRLIKRPLLAHIKAESTAERNIIMVTSSIEGEGKTFSAVNLAMSMAMERDKTVLLIDTDVIKKSSSKLLEVDGKRPGLIDVLNGSQSDISEVIMQTDMPSLRFIPAGEDHDHSTELLASEHMHNLAAELATRYPDRVVIFDAPPILLTTEAKVLSSLVGQIVFVVEAERTSQSLVSEALSHFSHGQSIGLILNKSRKRGITGYGYGYGYGQYHSDQPSSKSG